MLTVDLASQKIVRAAAMICLTGAEPVWLDYKLTTRLEPGGHCTECFIIVALIAELFFGEILFYLFIDVYCTEKCSDESKEVCYHPCVYYVFIICVGMSISH